MSVTLKQGESVSLTTGKVEMTPKTERTQWVGFLFDHNDPQAIADALYPVHGEH